MKNRYRHPIRYVQTEYHRGKHSNIPLCCIVWYFVRVYSGWVYLLINYPKVYRIWRRLRNRCDYIRCPLCAYFGHKVELHNCTKACRGMKGATRCH